MLKSKLDVREKALEIAADIMGRGVADKDVVSKAAEIEKYLMGSAELPEVSTDDVVSEASTVSAASKSAK